MKTAGRIVLVLLAAPGVFAGLLWGATAYGFEAGTLAARDLYDWIYGP